MSQTYNIYCDESCHLEHDRQKVMVLGAIWCPLSRTAEINKRIRAMKARHGLAADFEIKWTKVSKSKVGFYLELVDYFFAEEDLHFRAVVVPDKSKLDHATFGHDHDTYYYKMYFLLISALIDRENCFRIYLDIKDTRSAPKIRKLYEVLRNANYDFESSIITRLQPVHSHEVSVLQFTDLLMGAISYINRGLTGNAGKLAVIERIKERSRLSLIKTTLLRETKMNILIWEPQVR
jgi:hypothetical protein